MKLKVGLGQFSVAKEWQENLQICQDYMSQANEQDVDLLVFPEGILARDIADPDLVRRAAQPLNGPFMTELLAFSQSMTMTVLMTVHVPSEAEDGKVWNVQVAIRQGEIISEYKKLHLYDAFSMKESTNVIPGDDVPELVEVNGFNIGMMTCYDLRFPELSRRLVLDGADALVLPAAWVKGPLKEHHWDVLATARALENTCYMIAVGESGERNIGLSKVIDPLGVVTCSASEQDELAVTTINKERIAHARRVLPALENRRFSTPTLMSE
ncbi:deaminated glutathione amidase [Vibrio nitrifigilis]|uniref:Deaminated glutathione amidase n=1 Tax=Vibrio nitrifigilis TaxID=2789781 RepID=A0ABS0GL28_9VIBR|nr:deaminated glutathione amidase [Vibrio nitrifigilis]MBF9003133.1 deaminated glutathione amidase [Vibrio nitrifigilis]